MLKTTSSGPKGIYTKQVFKGAAHRKFCPFSHVIEVKNVNAKEFTLTAPASTMSIDRDGEIILPTAFDIPDYLKNPMFLWNHEWYGPPESAIGSVLDATTTENELVCTFQYDAGVCPFAKRIWDKVTITKSIRGFSVGFRMLEWVSARSAPEAIDALPPAAAAALRRGDVWLVHTKVEWIETSQVLIPCNIDSLTNVDEPVTLGLAPDDRETKHPERTDDTMDYSKLSAEMENVQKTLTSISANQETFASALSSVAEATKQTAEALASLKTAPPTTPPLPAPAPEAATKTMTIDDVPDELVDQIVAQALEAFNE